MNLTKTSTFKQCVKQGEVVRALNNATYMDLANAMNFLSTSTLLNIADLAVAEINDDRKARGLPLMTIPSYDSALHNFTKLDLT